MVSLLWQQDGPDEGNGPIKAFWCVVLSRSEWEMIVLEKR